MLTKLTPRPELLNLFSKIFRKRWNEAEAKAQDGRSAIKHEMATIEKKIGQMLDKTVQSKSRSVIARFESEVDRLELEKLLLDEKPPHAAPLRRTMMRLFEPLSTSSQTLGIYELMVRLTTSVSC